MPALGKMNYFPVLSVQLRRAVVIGAVPDVPLSAPIAAQCSVLEQGHPGGKGVSTGLVVTLQLCEQDEHCFWM